jgi:hypothetical protein
MCEHEMVGFIDVDDGMERVADVRFLNSWTALLCSNVVIDESVLVGTKILPSKHSDHLLSTTSIPIARIIKDELYKDGRTVSLELWLVISRIVTVLLPMSSSGVSLVCSHSMAAESRRYSAQSDRRKTMSKFASFMSRFQSTTTRISIVDNAKTLNAIGVPPEWIARVYSRTDRKISETAHSSRSHD